MAMNIMNCRGRMFKILGCKWYSRMLLVDMIYIYIPTFFWGAGGTFSDLFTWRI